MFHDKFSNVKKTWKVKNEKGVIACLDGLDNERIFESRLFQQNLSSVISQTYKTYVKTSSVYLILIHLNKKVNINKRSF